MKKLRILSIVIIILMLAVFALYSNTAEADINKNSSEISSSIDMGKALRYIAASLAIVASTFSSGIAIGRIGSAAMGAVSENPQAGGTAMILAALAEGVCLWGIAGAVLILVL